VTGKFKSMLGIHSPSRVFAQFGDFTMQGLAGGLDRSQGEPLQQVTSVGDRITHAGAGMSKRLQSAGSGNIAPSSRLDDLRERRIARAGSTAESARAAASRDKLRQASAGFALGAAVLPVMAAAAPVVAPAAATAVAGGTGASSYTINIHPPAGADSREIADLVRQAIEQIEREKVTRRGARLSD